MSHVGQKHQLTGCKYKGMYMTESECKYWLSLSTLTNGRGCLSMELLSYHITIATTHHR